ncbi:unnamed protein product [Ectocarpus sp. CCAP 1310/34]|nr:unnamed protein product [Ectocarpus sp. CCAP 1310/34]
MSLKDAVSALRSLKAELEACRSSKAELEVAYRGVLNVRVIRFFVAAELRLAKEDKQLEGQDPSRSVGNTNDDDAPWRGDDSGIAEVEREERRETLEEEARCLREELAAVKARAEEAVASINQELEEAVCARESACSAAAAAQGELVQEKARAAAAERQLKGATEEAAQLRTRLNDTTTELESARNALETDGTNRVGKSTNNGDDDEDAALKLIRDAITAQPPSSPARTEGQEAVRPVASEDAVASALEKVNQLQEELESTVRDNVELRRLIENTRQREEEENQHRLVQEGEAAAALAAMSSQLAESTEELEGLRERLKNVEQEEARIRASCSEKVSALEAAEGEVASLGASLAHTTEALEEARQLVVTREEESSTAQRELAVVREELSNVAEKESNAAALAAEAEEGRAAAALAATVVLERERAATSEALSRVKELETTLRETEAGRESLLDTAASDAKKIEALAADVAKGLEEKEAAKEEARGAEARASTAEAKVSRVKSKVAALKETMAEAEKAHKVAVEKEVEARLAVEETLLMANKELQRLKIKNEEALSASNGLREECEVLKATVETLRAAAVAAAGDGGNKLNDVSTAVATQTDEAEENEEKEGEFARLRAVVEEMKRGGDEVGVVRGCVGDVSSHDGRDPDDSGSDEEEGDGARRHGKGRASTKRQILAERDSLRAELASEKEQAAVRAAGLEAQLADKEREAADTQRRLYLRQSELETELEDLNAHHDALRVELARMDASIENASDASLRRIPSSSATSMVGRGGGRLRAGGGSVASPKSTGRDPASIGAEVGGAVGGILRGKFWSGWGGGSVTSADTNGGGSTGDAGAGKGPAAAARKGSKARREGGRGDGEGKISAGAAGAGEADQRSISRVRENMMARLQEAAREGKAEQKETSGGADGVKNKDVGHANTNNSGLQGASGNNMEETRSENKDVSDVGMAAAPRTVEDEWVEENVEHPPPDYGLESPVIRYLLQQWSTDPDKIKYLSLWLRCVIERRKVPDAFPSGLQLVGLAPEIKDGFLTLVIPMIRFTGGIPVLVHSRRSPPEESAPAGAGTPAYPDGHSKETALWDLRVKVDLNG